MEGAFAPWHIIILVLVFMALFGAKRLPDSARALGQSLRIFKAETRVLKDGELPVVPTPDVAFDAGRHRPDLQSGGQPGAAHDGSAPTEGVKPAGS